MAGHVIYHYLRRDTRFEVKSLDELIRNEFRVSPETLKTLSDVIQSYKPSHVINAVGALIKDSRDDPAKSIFVNSFLPHWLVEVANLFGFRVIHISTDCVFSGRQGGYVESSPRDADDVYGKSKALGELIDSNHLTLRTSIIGPELRQPGPGLFDWAFRQRATIAGFSRVFWSGVTTIDLARAIKYAIEEDVVGLKHLSHRQKISKLEILNLINDTFQLPLLIVDDPTPRHDKSLVPSNDFAFKPLDYPEMIMEIRSWIETNRPLYPHYAF